ncbi:lipopolysaccharide assembly protein LapB [Planktothrix sp. FACHB-1365]|uniref:tetratricopeptide repeat protein n=1 Tax=Planktothrix sp. FACHB-1365 TaxID=2692855 RepID=UPI001689A797|nr:tetratricopeptide repeat protein [Planktothrix sp. FACHB-1365]MBD2482703.1 tetratricopeptide repeat protein [Planktothrix sp. FACHB-1365]
MIQLPNQALYQNSIDLILEQLNIDSAFFKTLPRFQRMNYIATVRFLRGYKTHPDEQSSQKVKNSLEALYHLCTIPEWVLTDSTIITIFELPIAINPSTTNLLLPLSEYLFFKGSYQTLLGVTQEIIDSLKTSSKILNDILLLKAITLSSLNQNPTQVFQILQEISATSHPQSLQHIKANCHLAMYQVSLGNYQDGIRNLKKWLVIVDENLKHQNLAQSDFQLDDIKTGMLEILAHYEMNASHFDQALEIYDQVINLRKKLGLIHRIITPQVHQGIILRRKRQYDQGIKVLQNAQEKAKQINYIQAEVFIAHHLAYIYLNQGNLIEAKKLAIVAFEGYKKAENYQGISDCYEQLGLINLAENKCEQAIQNFKIALEMRQASLNRHGTASCLLDLALAYWHKKQIMKSIFFLIKGLQSYAQLGILNRVRFMRMLKIAYSWTLGKQN